MLSTKPDIRGMNGTIKKKKIINSSGNHNNDIGLLPRR